MHSDGYLNGILTELETRAAVDVIDWIHASDHMRSLSFPETEEARAKICYGILKKAVKADDPMLQYRHWGGRFERHGLVDSTIQEFTEGIIKPLIDYICDRINDEGNLLYLIERFKLKCEWFQQTNLYNQYTAAPSIGESELTATLRASLFDAGIDFPFSQPDSPSGRVDTVASMGTRDPLVLEVKVFDPARDRRARNLNQGFHQVFRYAQDYDSSVGYLVIFNCSDQELVIAPGPDVEPEYPIRIEHGAKSVFVVVVNVNPTRQSASKENPSTRVSITHEQLTKSEEAC